MNSNSLSLVLSGSDSKNELYAVLELSEQRTEFAPLILQPEGDKWIFTSLDPISPIGLNFVDRDRQPINPRTNRRLYLAHCNPDGIYLPLRVDNGELIISDSPIDDRTVYLQVPAESNFGYNDIRGRNWIQVGGNPLAGLIEIGLQAVGLSLSPLKDGLPDPNDRTIIVGNPCLPNCVQKKCTEDNGCGQPCSCPPGFACNAETGNCDRLKKPCDGECKGDCPGRCPNGQNCRSDSNGHFRCVPSDLNSDAISFLIGILVIIILIILILIVWYLK